ncbi:unnamed protein product [Fraxinus pennsylvanica]|uniref:Uncharacterized protein n=1 Tax=Fraxinus pennsylvanica TaxID=56036 RepID=A0AAD1ZIA1_9LAMI|nr:unnamed protein product [Fraxinus pennsylvanica]
MYKTSSTSGSNKHLDSKTKIVVRNGIPESLPNTYRPKEVVLTSQLILACMGFLRYLLEVNSPQSNGKNLDVNNNHLATQRLKSGMEQLHEKLETAKTGNIHFLKDHNFDFQVPQEKLVQLHKSQSTTDLTPSPAISEIQPSSLDATSKIVTDQFLDVWQLVRTPEVPPVTFPPTNAIMPKLSEIVQERNVDVMPSETESDTFMDPTSFKLDDKIPLEIGIFSPDSQMA